MAIGSGSHWEGPLYGSDRAQGGLCEDVPVFIQSNRFRLVQWYDFVDAQEDDQWTATQLTGSGAMALSNGSLGILQLTSTTNDQGLGSVQSNLTVLRPSTVAQADGATARTISFGARVRVSDFSDASWYVGLAANDTTFMAATGLLLAVGGDNCVGFHHVGEASTQGGILGPDGNDIRMVSAGTALANYEATLLSAGNGAPIAAPANSAVDSVFREYGIRLRGTNQVEYYVNGVLRHRRTMATALAAADVQPTFALITNGNAITIEIDYVWAVCTR